MYQVKGDAEHMRYQPPGRMVNILQSATFLNIYHLAVVTEQQHMMVRQVAEGELPPQAATRQSVTENCEGWNCPRYRQAGRNGGCSSCET